MALIERYNNYLSSYFFNSNCIEFRIQSSKALEKFKNVQSFQLNQLVNGRFYFAQDRREILLLKYDMWCRWLFEVENLFIELSGCREDKVVIQDDIDFICKLADKTMQKYHSVIQDEAPEKFNSKFIEIWLKIHSYSYEYMIEEFKELNNLSFNKAFIQIVDILVYIMQYTLIEIYELDSLFCQRVIKCEECPYEEFCPKNKREDGHASIPFLIIGPISKNCKKSTFECLPVKRLVIYRNYFDISEIYFKNYTDEPINEDIINMINSFGIKINFRKCIVK